MLAVRRTVWPMFHGHVFHPGLPSVQAVIATSRGTWRGIRASSPSLASPPIVLTPTRPSHTSSQSSSLILDLPALGQLSVSVHARARAGNRAIHAQAGLIHTLRKWLRLSYRPLSTLLAPIDPAGRPLSRLHQQTSTTIHPHQFVSCAAAEL